MINQKKSGVVLSYINTVLSLCITVFLTPFILKSLGESEYGVYKMIASFASQLVIINFGIGTVVSRFVAKYNALEQKKEKENFLFMILIISVLISSLIGLVGYLLSFGIDEFFGNSLTESQIDLAKKLYLILTATTTVSVFRDMFTGIIQGNERFVPAKVIGLLRLILRVILIIILLKLGYSSLAIVTLDLVLSILVTVVEMFYSFVIVKERIKFYYWDKKEFFGCMTFSGAIILQSIVNQVNQNIDSIILGATIVENVTKIVTLYSFALVIYNSYGNITSIVSSVFMPQVTRMVVKDASSEELSDVVIRVGRYQMMMAGGVVFGFILCGQNFLHIWVGEEYVDAYYSALLLIIPTTIPLVESVAVSILDAKMKRMVRSVVLVITAIFNVISSVIFIKMFGYIGAAIGTALSIIVGHGIIMNVYYHKYIGLNVKRIFLQIFKGILPCAVISAIICTPISYFVPNTVLGFVVKVITFVVIYGVLLYFFGMNKSEKETTVGAFLKKINKVVGRLKK